MMENWVLLSLLSAFSLATSDALTKRVITHENEYVIAWFRVLFGLPALLIALLPAVFDALATVSHYYAISMANVAYMIAIKRTSLLIGSIYGFLLFRERNMRERLLGATLMFTGFVVIVVAK